MNVAIRFWYCLQTSSIPYKGCRQGFKRDDVRMAEQSASADRAADAMGQSGRQAGEAGKESQQEESQPESGKALRRKRKEQQRLKQV